MGRVNPAEGGIHKVVKEYRQLLRLADKSDVVPLGQERLSTDQASKRFESMSSGQKQGMIDQLGMEEVMKLVRRIGK